MRTAELKRTITLLAIVVAVGCADRDNEVPNLPPQDAAVPTTQATETQTTPPETAETSPRPTQSVPRIGPEEAKAAVDRGEAILVDVRTAEAYTFQHAAGSVSIPEDQIPARASLLPPDKMIITYCT